MLCRVCTSRLVTIFSGVAPYCVHSNQEFSKFFPSLCSNQLLDKTDATFLQDMIMTAEDPNAAMAARMAAAAAASSSSSVAEPSSPCSSGNSSSTSGVGGSGADIYRSGQDIDDVARIRS